MGLATQPSVVQFSDTRNRISELNSMSQHYHQAGIFNFSNGFERSQLQPPPHVAQQIRRDKLRVQGFDPPQPLVGLDDDESTSTAGLPVAYEAAGMLSEMFNFPSGGPTSATELLESQIISSYRRHHPPPPHPAAEWFPNRQMMAGADLAVSKNQTAGTSHPQISSMNPDPAAAAMQLFLMNPHHQQRSPSPSTSNPPPLPQPDSSTLRMLLPNPSGPAGGGFGNFTWVKDNRSDIPGMVEGQGLSLSLSSSLQQIEAAKAEELRMGENNMLFICQGGGAGPSAPPPPQYQLRNLGGGQTQVGLGTSPPSSSYGAVSLLRNSKYAKAVQELLEEFCSVGRGQLRKTNFRRGNNNDDGNPSSAGGDGNASSSSKDQNPPLSAADRLEHQRRKAKLLSMLEEVDRRYNHYFEQMQMVVNSFDMVMGFGSAALYTSLAQKAMSRHFRCLKDAVAAQVKHCCAALGEKDAAASGVTKGETPRLRMLEQSLRQQRAFQQMGLMEQEAWRPQRGLPERSVNILRAWLFEHFLHPYPSDADKHLLARQTGLSRNQVSNWFINARVRLWKPMVEEMYQQEAKDEEDEITNDDGHNNNNNNNQRDQISSAAAQNAELYDSSDPTIAGVAPVSAVGESPEDVECQENHPPYAGVIAQGLIFDSAVAPPVGHPLPESNSDDIEATLLRFGTGAAGDVSLTLGLRHAGNFPEKGPFSVRDYRGR